MAEDTTTESTATPYEEKALARGWRPKDEFEGDADLWVDARAFVEKGELMDTIHTGNRERKRLEEEISTIKGTVGELRKHYEGLAKAEVDAELKALRKERREALRVDDLDSADELEDRIEEVRTQKAKIEAQPDVVDTPTTPQLSPEANQWLNDNPWANENSPGFQGDLASEALALLRLEVDRTGDTSINSFNKVKNKMERLYPERFGTATRATTSIDSTHTSTNNGPSSRGNLARKMNSDQARVGAKLVQLGTHKNLEEYAKELKTMGEL